MTLFFKKKSIATFWADASNCTWTTDTGHCTTTLQFTSQLLIIWVCSYEYVFCLNKPLLSRTKENKLWSSVFYSAKTLKIISYILIPCIPLLSHEKIWQWCLFFGSKTNSWFTWQASVDTVSLRFSGSDISKHSLCFLIIDSKTWICCTTKTTVWKEGWSLFHI